MKKIILCLLMVLSWHQVLLAAESKEQEFQHYLAQQRIKLRAFYFHEHGVDVEQLRSLSAPQILQLALTTINPKNPEDSYRFLRVLLEANPTTERFLNNQAYMNDVFDKLFTKNSNTDIIDAVKEFKNKIAYHWISSLAEENPKMRRSVGFTLVNDIREREAKLHQFLYPNEQEELENNLYFLQAMLELSIVKADDLLLRDENDQDVTAYTYAEQHEDEELMSVLLNYGAVPGAIVKDYL